MLVELTHTRNLFLLTDLAGRREVRFAGVAVLASAVLFSAIAPFATKQLAHVPAFIPAYESALVLSDLITAVLLFGQFNFLRSRPLLVLACGYLFTAVIAFVHMLTFPGVFSPTGLLGAGSQSTAWLYMFWHAGFPLFVIVYTFIGGMGRGVPASKIIIEAIDQPHAEANARFAILAGVILVLVAVGALTLIATVYQDTLPALIVNTRFTPALHVVVASIWMVSLIALAVLGWRGTHTMLDVWVMVVMSAWLFEIALSAALNAGRYDLGWYVGRMYGLFASSFLLIILLIENVTHYARLARLSAELSAANETLEQLSLHDALTGLANRRFFDQYLSTQIILAGRSKRPLALVLCDVDIFKAYNDHYGHQAGDECLKRIASTLRACCNRPADMVARYGGEEFAIILPDTELAGATHLAEAVRKAVEELAIVHQHSPVAAYVTISGGVSVLTNKAVLTEQHLIGAADQALYQAKHLGRNNIVSVHAEPERDAFDVQ